DAAEVVDAPGPVKPGLGGSFGIPVIENGALGSLSKAADSRVDRLHAVQQGRCLGQLAAVTQQPGLERQRLGGDRGIAGAGKKQGPCRVKGIGSSMGLAERSP